ncbi:MAG: hypothetical protein JWP69_272 [Flaviaesturariibacter sp.]|nr:hypothetical protein [Flaviaesturariibacter sp.]
MDIENQEFLLFLKCEQQNKLRFMIVGGYAVNYFGYHRATDDLDIWIAPTEENKIHFLDTLRCMKYADEEIALIAKEDFTTHFICSLGERPSIIDVLTIIYHRISFDEAEKALVKHRLSEDLVIPFVPYSFLKDIKLESSRGKDLFDIARLEELINKK